MVILTPLVISGSPRALYVILAKTKSPRNNNIETTTVMALLVLCIQIKVKIDEKAASNITAMNKYESRLGIPISQTPRIGMATNAPISQTDIISNVAANEVIRLAK